MTGDDRFPEPGPVAEYRDPELVRRFESEPVPQHGAGFWNELEARLGGGRAESDPEGETTLLSPSVHLASAPPPGVDAIGAGRWSVGRWLAAAAATVAVLGLGGALLVAQSRSTSPVESAAPSPESESGADAGADEREPTTSSTSTTQLSTTAAGTPSTTTTASSAPVETPPSYLSDEVRVDPVGPGEVVAFSPDDSAVLVVDDGPGVAAGCEGAELLALFTQDLATGQRRPTLGDGFRIETGGVELAISPFEATPGEVGTRPVYGREWCDGLTISLWRGMMGRDGQISAVESLAIGGDDDPFAGRQTVPAEPEPLISPDGRWALVASGSTAGVVEVDADGNATGPVVHTVPDGVEPASLETAAWAPTGDAIALAADGAVILWAPWVGGHQRFESEAVIDLIFDNTGGRLAVVSIGDRVTSTILTFGDRPAPVPAPPRCSGRVPFSPLAAGSSSVRGLPPDVVATAVAVDEAAATCDWEALGRLTPERFVASPAGGEAVEVWPEEEAGGQSPMWFLRTALRQPHIVDDTARPTMHIWPAVSLDADCSFTETDRRSLTALGYDAELVEQACPTEGGYVGYRTAIDATGTWRSFVAGP